MKRNLNLNNLLNTLAAAIIIFAIIKSQVHYYPNRPDSITTLDNNIKPIDPPISDTLPHSKYIKLKDSIITMRNLKNGDLPEGNFRIYDIGLYSSVICDTCNLKWPYYSPSNNNGFEKNYLLLYDWKLKKDENLGYVDDGKFYAEHGQGYVRRAIAVAIHRNDNPPNNRILIKDIPVLFGYSQKEQCIKIPIGPLTARILKFIFIVLLILNVVYFLFLVAAFLKFIIDLSRGRSFSDKNIFRLKIIALSLISYPIIKLLFSYFFRIIFNSYFIKDVIFTNKEWGDNSWIILVIGSVFLLLYNAFRQGKSLQEEQDLTV